MKTAAEIYRFPVDPESDTAAAHVLRLVGKGGAVIEIGAGPGSIARALAELNGCRLSAIDIDPASVEILREFCKPVWRLDLNDPRWIESVAPASFDAVVLADVLEHLVDPWATLRLAAGLVNATGAVVVSLPHVAHAAVMACLINQDFEYREWGLLDRTHIRFFAMKNIQALFDEAGLAIVDFAFVRKTPAETELAATWAALPQRTRTVLQAGDFADVYQIVLRAVPAGRADAGPARSLLEARPAAAAASLRYVAFYLPQFHPVPENDRWWGKGFTEWTNVTKARPLFDGHYQPHLPTEMGFYDLRLRDVQREQAALARAYGIDAFCFHYYWFGGKRLLERPVEDFLADPTVDIQFCLCWANENWTRKWDASEHEILIEQTYSPELDIRFIDSVIPFFRDPRHVRVDGAPVLVVYRPQQIPDAKATAAAWRRRCREAGIGDIHLVAALTHGNRNFEAFGFDAGVEFPPHNADGAQGWPANRAAALAGDGRIEGLVWDYADVAKSYLGRDHGDRPVYRTVFPSWDNTARLGARALIVHGASVEHYERWLAGATQRTAAERLPGERLVFINAWNEWAEGCHLEPDRIHGRAFLEATLRAKNGTSTVAAAWPEASAAAPAEAVAAIAGQERSNPMLPRLGRALRSVFRRGDAAPKRRPVA